MKKIYNIKVTNQDGDTENYNICIEKIPQGKADCSSKFVLLLGCGTYACLGLVAVLMTLHPDIGRQAISFFGLISSLLALFIVIFSSVVFLAARIDSRKNKIVLLVFVLYSLVYMALSYVCLEDNFIFEENLGDCATILGVILAAIAALFDSEKLIEDSH